MFILSDYLIRCNHLITIYLNILKNIFRFNGFEEINKTRIRYIYSRAPVLRVVFKIKHYPQKNDQVLLMVQ